MKYRSDIDGLRAFAVVPVILSHAGLSTFGGGFIGVDIFFVISGFLITRILIGELESGEYSLLGFYERRARRIMPALLLVLAVSFPFAWTLMLPEFLQNFAQSVVATLLFSNNLLLALTSGYWDLDSSFKPLLHTWSLGVEEQFYLVFPLILASIWCFGRRVQLATILVLGLVSLGLAEYGLRTNPSMNFYLPTFLFTEHTPSPSLYMAVPVLGTAAVLMFSRPGTITCRLLSFAPFVWIGLVSYSAYLWHQPLFAFARIALFEPPSLELMMALTMLTFVLAWLSWRFVEAPFRNRKRVPMRAFGPSTAAICVMLIVGGVYLHVAKGMPKRIFPNIAATGDIYIGYNERIRQYATDIFPTGDGPNVLILGNSFGRDVANTLFESGVLENVNLVYSTANIAYLKRNARWPHIRNHLLPEADVVIAAVQYGPAEDVLTGEALLSGLTDAPVLVFGPKDFGYNLNPFGRVPMAERSQSFASVDSEIATLNRRLSAEIPQDSYLNMLDLMGIDEGNRIHVFDADGNPLSPDRKHLTRYGAIYLADRMKADRPDFLARIDPEIQVEVSQ